MALRVAERTPDLIGQTPLLRLGPPQPAGGARIGARLELEYVVSGSSVKDRAAHGLAFVGRQRAYPVLTIIPRRHGMLPPEGHRRGPSEVTA